tara:strand:+ start:1259 stop:1972 length:714 start_codon:yes stop_codon:yes gene_type:complete
MPNRNIILTLDTETADLSGNVYDLGYIIHDRAGNELARFNALVEEIFTQPKIMMGAFYAKKLFSHYAPMLDRGEIKMQSWQYIIDRLRSDIVEYNVSTIAAYNIGFDMRAMNNTHRSLTDESKVLESPCKILDIWQFACEVKLNNRNYKRVAESFGWVSPKGNIKTGAEFAYRFCSGDHGFIEDHTALSDCQIEVEILRQCFATKKKIPYGKFNKAPWRIVNPSAGNDAHVHGSIVA